MKILQVSGDNKDFALLCKKLEEFQYNLLPILREKDYSLTDNLEDIIGFILYDDNKPIGSIGFRKNSDDVCQIVRVFVDENYRGKGYSKLLFEKIENLVKDLGFKRAEIEAWCDAKVALKLYEKMGYIKSEEKVSEWYGGSKYVELFKIF